MKKKIVMTLIYLSLIIIEILSISLIIYFIIKQSDLSTAYFWESKPVTGQKITSFDDYMYYVNNGGTFIRTTTTSIILASLVLISSIFSLILSFKALMNLHNYKISDLKYSYLDYKEKKENKKKIKIKKEIEKLQNQLK